MSKQLLSFLGKRSAPALFTFDFPAFFGARDGFVWMGYPGFSQVYTDSGMTTPVTNSYDPVGAIEDASGNGNHLIQTVSINKPFIHKGIYYGGPPNTQPFTSRNIKILNSGYTSYGPGAWLETPYQLTSDCTIIGIVGAGTNQALWTVGSVTAFCDYVGSGPTGDMARITNLVGGDVSILDVIHGTKPFAMLDTEFLDVGGGNVDVTLRASNNLATGVVSTTVTRTAPTPANIKSGIGITFCQIPFLMAIDGQLSSGERTTIHNLINDAFASYA